MVLRAIPLWSETLGLSGRADAVEMHSGVVRPVEYKSGTRHGLAADLQLCAQALCLEEMLDVEIPDGDIWYGGPRRRVSRRYSLPHCGVKSAALSTRSGARYWRVPCRRRRMISDALLASCCITAFPASPARRRG